MTHKERFLAILEGRKPDRIPWVPRMKLWYEFHKRKGTLPQRYQGCTLREIEKDLGMGTPAKRGKIFEVRLTNDVEISDEKKGLEVTTHYVTPKGTVTVRERSSQEGFALQIVDHMIKGVDDYPIMEYLVEHLEFIPTYEEYLDYEEEIGKDGVPLARAGLWPPGNTGRSIGTHCPMHLILKDFLGYENGYLHLLCRYPRQVRHLLEVLTEKSEEMQEVVLQSPARLIYHGAHFDRQMTPPAIFKQYFTPYFRDFAKKLHSLGKKLVCHLDAETKGLFELVAEAGFDLVESFTTVPLVQHTTVAEARKKWGDRIVIWGGIPSVILEPSYERKKFEQYMFDLFRAIAPGDHFILGIGDNLMPTSDFSRVIQISEMVQDLGKYPIKID